MQNQDYHRRPAGMTFGVQLLLILNISAFVLEVLFGVQLSSFCALRANWLSYGAFWQLITYQFIHQGTLHLFANMLGLFFLGPDTERALGTNRFIRLYLFSGMLGGLGWSILSPGAFSCVGASGAVFGVLGAYAALYPNRELILIFLPFTPIKAWVFVLLLGTYEFFLMLNTGSGGHIANSAHLSGGIAGYFYALFIGRPDVIRKIRNRIKPKGKAPVDRAKIDQILDKASRDGLHALTRREREVLKRSGKQ